jgi:glucokinase
MAKKSNQKYYIGVDVGGTKILAALTRASGKILARKRCPTPRNAQPDEVLATVVGVIDELLAGKKLNRKAVRAIGLAVPGVVDAERGRVVVTPNMNLSGFDIADRLKKHFDATIAVGNDVNLGTLGEQWLGAAAFADSAVGIFVGTGIGGGIIVNGRLVTGHRGAAAEVGHMRVQKDGPTCGCGGKGCLEALASRTAIERELRGGIAAGRKTVLTDMLKGDMSVIRSSVLKRALAEKDELVVEVMTRAAETLGDACLELRHILDPEVIVLGGGVVEACKGFILPIVERTIAADPLAPDLKGGKVVVSTLGDDAVALGGVVLAQQAEGRDPFAKSRKTLHRYPFLTESGDHSVTVDGVCYTEDIIIHVDGKVNKRSKVEDAESVSPHQIDRKDVKSVCSGKPSIVIIGTGHCGGAALTEKAEEFLVRHGVSYDVLPTGEAVSIYNAIKGNKAALIHVRS